VSLFLCIGSLPVWTQCDSGRGCNDAYRG